MFMGFGFPDFLGVGVQKGGTTTLQKMLEQHPDVFLPAVKEVHYFTFNYIKGKSWYQRQFEQASANQCCGEITPYYIFHPQAPERIHALNPQVRLIVLLRDPVERALSHFFHCKRLGLESLELEDALELESDRLNGAEEFLIADDSHHLSHQLYSYVSRSCYEQQLTRLNLFFKPPQVLVLRSEDLFSTPQLVWDRVLLFLQLDYCPLPQLRQPANAGFGESAGVLSSVRRSLREKLLPTYHWAEEKMNIVWENSD